MFVNINVSISVNIGISEGVKIMSNTTEKDKTGLDVENGEYKVTGLVITKKVFKRKANKKGVRTNIAPHPIGYRVENIKTGESKLVEKTEGVLLVGRYKSVNAYVMKKDKSEYDRETGELLKVDYNTYLQPFPAVHEAFTKDDRLINVFEYDENGDIRTDPLTITLKEEDCTENLWNIIQREYKNKSSKKMASRGKSVRETSERAKVLEDAFQQMLQNNDFNLKI